MNRFSILFFLCLWIQVTCVISQTNTYLDSLSIAYDLYDQDKIQKAEDILCAISNSCEKATFNVQTSYNYLRGCSLFYLEQPDKAIPYFDKAVNLMEMHLDTLGQDYYECMHGEASSYLALKDTVNAERIWRHAFIRFSTVSPDVVSQCGVITDIITSLGDIYNAKGDTTLAKDIYFYATQVSLYLLGESGLDTLSSEVINTYVEKQNSEGLAFLRTGQYTEAVNRFTELIRFCQDNENEEWQGILYHNLGRTMMLQEDYEKAIQCLEKSKEIQIRVYGTPMESTINYLKDCKTRI